MRRIPLALVAVAVLAVSPAYAVTIIDNNFDGNDGNDIGGLFNIVSNGLEGGDITNAATGLTSFSGASAAVGFSSSTSFDAQAYSSLTVTWTVDGVINAGSAFNGWFFGLQSAQGMQGVGSTLWNNTPNSIGVNLFGAKGGFAGDDATVAQDSPELALIDVQSAIILPTDSETVDGFSVSLTLNSDDTYSVSSSGLKNEFDQNLGGAMPAGFSYADLGSSTFASTTFQTGINSPFRFTAQIGSVVVEGTRVPEPGSLALLALGSMFFLGGASRRKQA